VDASPAAVRYARERAAGDVHEATVEKMPFMDGSFDLVASMDVLYMAGVRQDRAMAEFSRVLKPGGVLALNLAAFDFLKGQHDMAVKTERRYTKGSVKRLLESAGLRVERIFYWNNLLFFPLLVWRPLSRLFASTEAPRSDIRRLPGWVNGALKGYLCAEAGIARRASLPFGVSVFALARKA
jgi:SAM-dependent methyltransferase